MTRFGFYASCMLVASLLEVGLRVYGAEQSESLPANCAQIQHGGANTHGVYTIYPSGQPLEVYCDLTTDRGGWTVFQRRLDGSVDFYRDWVDYKNGFGSASGECWLGNDHIHSLTSNGSYVLRIDMETFDGETRFAEYVGFSIDAESTNYALRFEAYLASSTAGDSLSDHKDKPFSTKDADHDTYGGSCSSLHHGAWWYTSCHSSNLNGQYYQEGDRVQYAKGVVWYAWKGNYVSYKTVTMKMRPAGFTPSNSSTGCDTALGIEQGTMLDAQFTASSALSGKQAHRARLNHYRSDGGSAWVASTTDQYQFLQVDLLRTHQLSKLAVQGGGSACYCHTSEFKLLYSVDGLVWKFYESGRLQQGNSDRYRTVTLTFQSPITVGPSIMIGSIKAIG
ncbi:Ficolin-1 [Lamellibrachia satsuma]|nr:Ficolin-1 [Lamellibrachia satsuma]